LPLVTIQIRLHYTARPARRTPAEPQLLGAQTLVRLGRFGPAGHAHHRGLAFYSLGERRGSKSFE